MFSSRILFVVTLIHTLLLIEPFSIPAPQYRIYHGLPIKWVGPRGELQHALWHYRNDTHARMFRCFRVNASNFDGTLKDFKNKHKFVSYKYKTQKKNFNQKKNHPPLHPITR